MKKDRYYYIGVRDKFFPSMLKIIFLESPPISGLYFYDISGQTSEPLFRAMMKLKEKMGTDLLKELTELFYTITQPFSDIMLIII